MLWFIVAGLSVVFLGHTAPFPFLLEAFAPSQSIWRMPVTDPPLVYLTYDDGPNPAATPQLLDVLREHDARATFFLIDAHLTEETATIVRRMFNDGHAVGLHADTRVLTVKTPAALAALLRGNADRIEQLTGHRPCRLFRPHAGWRSGSMYEGLARIEHRLVGWTWGLWDWNWYRPHDAARLAGRLGRTVSPGDIVVMHDGHHENPVADRQYAIEATRRLVPALRARGYRFGALCEPSDPVTTGSPTANTAAASSNSWLALLFRPFPPRRSPKVVELQADAVFGEDGLARAIRLAYQDAGRSR